MIPHDPKKIAERGASGFSEAEIATIDAARMGEIPGIARVFLNSWAFKVANPSFDIAKLRTDCCMMQRVATPPERIIDLEKFGELDAK